MHVHMYICMYAFGFQSKGCKSVTSSLNWVYWFCFFNFIALHMYIHTRIFNCCVFIFIVFLLWKQCRDARRHNKRNIYCIYCRATTLPTFGLAFRFCTLIFWNLSISNSKQWAEKIMMSKKGRYLVYIWVCVCLSKAKNKTCRRANIYLTFPTKECDRSLQITFFALHLIVFSLNYKAK